MDPAERENETERLKQKHADLEKELTPPVAPELVAKPVVDDKITRATRKALDLSDATVSVYAEEDLDERAEMDRVERLFKQYQTNMNRFLKRMQDLLIENIEMLEVLESHWQRLK